MEIDPEIMLKIQHELIVAMSNLAQGFEQIAIALENGEPRSAVICMVRQISTEAASMAKEMSA